jgi:hypothetical protein
MALPSRSQLLAEQLKQKMMAGLKTDRADLYRRIKEGTVIPILGNALRNDGIFDWYFASEAAADPLNVSSHMTVDDHLAHTWASLIDYPLPDTTNLARVALFNRVRSKDDEEAKVNYLAFLKNTLLLVASNDSEVRDQVPSLQTQVESRTFSELATELDYPRLPPGKEDPLRCLARMPLPIYITTSYYDFIERALEAVDRPPITQICFWNSEPPLLETEHKTRHDLVPTVNQPVVFHLFGLERYPSTLVLSEADYLDYLLKLIEDTLTTKTNTSNPILPLYLTTAMKMSSLVLLGYRLQDWDFRVLFRLIRQSTIRPYSLLLQMKPEQLARERGSSEEVRKYLEDFFRGIFAIQWGDPDEFVYQLCAEYKKWIQAES